MIIYTQEVEQFISGLNAKNAAKVARVLDLLEEHQYRLAMPYSKMLDRNIFELRITGRTQIRLIYTFKALGIIIFYGFIKKSQRIPRQELRTIYQKFLRL